MTTIDPQQLVAQMGNAFVAAAEAMNSPASSPEVRKQADEWLRNFQNEQISWQIYPSVLDSPTFSPVVHFFAANSLRHKIQHFFSELPRDQQEAMKALALSTLVKHKTSPSNVRTQLSLVIAEVALQMEWVDSAKELAMSFGTSAEFLCCVLRVLIVLAEEVELPDPEDEVRPSKLTTALQSQSEGVFGFLHHWYAQGAVISKADKNSILKCFARWLPFYTGSVMSLGQSPIILFAVGAGLNYDDDDVFAEVVEVVVALIRRSKQATPDVMPVVQMAISMVPRLNEMYVAALADDNTEGCRGVTQIASEIGENYHMLFLNGSPEAVKAVELLLLVASHPDESVNSISFYFWYLFSMQLQLEAHAQARGFYSLAFCRLIDILSSACKYPAEVDTWGEEKEEEFRQFRHSVSDTLADACRIAGEETLLGRVVPVLRQHLDQCLQHAGPWNEVESRLYTIRSVGRFVSEKNEMVKHVLDTYQSLPTHHRIRYTATLLIGRYSHWISAHPEYLPPMFTYAVAGLAVKEVTGAASMAIHYLCSSCADKMEPVMEQLLHVYDNLSHLPLVDQQEIIKGVGDILKKLPVGRHGETIGRLFEPLGASLQLSLHPDGLPSKQVVSTVVRITALLDAISASKDGASSEAQQAVLPIVLRLWPLLEGVFPRYMHVADVIEQSGRCVRAAIKCLGRAFEPLLQPAVNVLVATFAENSHSAALYAFNPLLAEFGCDVQHQAALFAGVLAFSKSAFAILGSPDGYKNNSDIVEEFFDVCGRCLRRFPEQFLQSLGDGVLQCALGGLEMVQVEAIECLLSFFENFLSCEPPKNIPDGQPCTAAHGAIVADLMSRHGQNLVTRLVNGVAGGMSTRVHSTISLVMGQCRKFPQFPQWLSAALATLTGAVPTMEEKHIFAKNMIELTERADLRRAVMDFSHRSRANRRFQ